LSKIDIISQYDKSETVTLPCYSTQKHPFSQ